MKNRTVVLASMLLVVGALMLLGSSYSLITGVVSDTSFGFEVSNFDVEFLDNNKISLSGIPMSDDEAINKSKEFTFTVANNSMKDVNCRLDIIENSETEMSDVIKYVYSLNNDTYSSTYVLKDNSTIKQNKVLKKGEKDTYKLKMWLSIDADESVMNKIFSASISLQATQNDFKYATSVIEYLANNNMDNVKGNMNNYRYTGSNPNNYVWFNCKDNYSKGKDNCEIWRIIGSFDNTWENNSESYKMLKIVRNDVMEEINFNNEEMEGDFDSSYINTFLNGSYYVLLNDSAQNLIMKANWNIGKISNDNNFSNVYYMEENKKYYANVGLLNVSDYLYLGSDNYLNSDKNILTLNKKDNDVNVINNGINTLPSEDLYNYLPCVYIRPDVSIVSGDGSINSPYELGIKYPMNYGNIK